MAIKSHKFKVEHSNFRMMKGGFDDCVRYSQALVLEDSKESAVIEIPPVLNPSMRKEALNLYLHRWESFGFKLTKM